jgi:hypothetical protein
MAYIRTIDRLGVACLDKDQRARTCSYWYCVRSYNTPETAFRTRAAFLQWLALYGLRIEGGEVPEEGQSAWLNISGQYREAMYLDRAAWEAVEGVKIMGMNNADYTEFRLAADADGTICAHYLNPNVRDRLRFDPSQARTREDAGKADFLLAPLDEPRRW